MKLKKGLLSLTITKTSKILNTNGNLKNVEKNDIFTINEEFKSPSRKIKIPNLILKISEKEVEDIDRTLQEERKMLIEAAIVRIMKSRRHMVHQNLVSEVISQLLVNFKPDPKDIKKRIEDLITREYLTRDSNDSNSYNYLP